jgi:penicillin amidase
MRRRGLLKGAAVLAGAMRAVPAFAASDMAMQGLSAPVEIVTDRHGIPHITAQTIPDAFFGQGYAAATHRLWQMDLSRRRGLGRLAAAFGPDFVPFDIAARTMLFRGDLAAEWQALDPRVPPILRAFVAGINARIREIGDNPALLPPEFAGLGAHPEEWAPEDLLRARYGGGRNVEAEFRRARLACRGILGADAITQTLQPPWTLAVPEGLDPCALHADDLALYHRLGARLPFGRAMQHAGLGLPEIDSAQGSNAWVVAPERSATGRAILANDPHLPFSVPGPRFITHLRAPGLDAIGAGPASRPGFQFGHTDRIAFGRTDFRIDQEDLYVLRLNEDATAYRAAAGWQPVSRFAETIEVRGSAPVTVTIGTTPLGPIIAEGPGRGLALRAASMLPGPPVGLEYVLVPLSTDWASYRRAISAAVWGSNYMYADTSGNIGWQTGGRAPRRTRHDGLMPVPAEGDYPWDGLIPIDELPGEYNPERGWIASANQMPFPPDYPIAERRVGFEWISDDRYRRICNVLATEPKHALADSVALQHDTFSLRAAALRPLLARVEAADLAGAVAMLHAWDGRVDAGSTAAALYEFWSAELQVAMAERLIPAAARGLITSVDPHVVRDLLLAPDARLGADPVAARDAIVAAALRAALYQVAGRDWGRIHTVDLHHSLSAAMPGLRSDVTGLGSGGDGTTVMARWWASIANPNTSGGAMFAAVVDVGNWDATQAVIAPGQSGDPRSPHYADGYGPWLAGEYFALPFGRAAVEAAAETRLTLVPGRGR